jgi:hypothetical protein
LCSQTVDWKARHKKVCKKAAEKREQVAQVGKMMQFFSDASFACSDTDSMAQMFSNMRAGLGPPPAVAEAVKGRRKELKDEKNRGRKKGRADADAD